MSSFAEHIYREPAFAYSAGFFGDDDAFFGFYLVLCGPDLDVFLSECFDTGFTFITEAVDIGFVFVEMGDGFEGMADGAFLLFWFFLLCIESLDDSYLSLLFIFGGAGDADIGKAIFFGTVKVESV